MKKSIKFADDVFDDDEEESNRSKFNSRVSFARPSIVQLDNYNLSSNQTFTVELRLIILKIGSISTKENKFSCEAFLEASWYDKNIGKNSKFFDANKLKYDEKHHWNPHLYIQNLLSHQSQEIWYNVEQCSKGCKISERRRFKGEFSQTFQLKNYPLDLQELTINISSFRTSQEIDLVISTEKLSSINVSTFTQTHEWTLFQTVCSSQMTKTNDITNENQSSMDISVCVMRKPNYYYWNSFLLAFIITMICLCCFAISCDLSGNRNIVATTVLLTLITFKWSVTKNLPSLSYLTILDQYTLMNIIIVFGNNIYFALMGVFAKETCPAPFRQIDFYVFIGSTSLFYLLNSIQVLRFFFIKYKNRKMLLHREDEYNKNNTAKRARIKSIFQNASFTE
ncbi:gamma aminobutyric acid receptor subunit [Brachionus plicatilis]|uniref:Gamma aminobutyric acid receptor subunit n=1 Tax=Brachionus plicatilis TaxID=10195 RepID=A0A3M7QGU5_BRAPC|nr:gamma aminobutyric acid receptor subunit [Brachionus plicatilis]